jgi:hypothetical protein
MARSLNIAIAEAASGLQFPNEFTTGLPDGWTPDSTLGPGLTTYSTPGATIEDIRFTGPVFVGAEGLTFTRCHFEGEGFYSGRSETNPNDFIFTGADPCLLEDCEFTPPSGKDFGPFGKGVAANNVILRRCKFWHHGRGVSLSDAGYTARTDHGPTVIEDCFFFMDGGTWVGTGAIGDCEASQFAEYGSTENEHYECVQGNSGRGCDISNSTLVFQDMCGTGPFYVGYGNSGPPLDPVNKLTYNLDHVLLCGGGTSFGLQVPGDVNELYVVDQSWVDQPTYNAPSQITSWTNCKLVTVEGLSPDFVGDGLSTVPEGLSWLVTGFVDDLSVGTTDNYA